MVAVVLHPPSLERLLLTLVAVAVGVISQATLHRAVRVVAVLVELELAAVLVVKVLMDLTLQLLD
jgi:hypothetical protein